MSDHAAPWDLTQDPLTLTRHLVDCPSESGDEQAIADRVEVSLRAQTALEITRIGNTIVGRTELGRTSRVVIAGHLDTVPVNDNLPSRLHKGKGSLEGGVLYGLGTCDMKGGVAIALHLAATITNPVHDITYLFYDCEEIEATRNGLFRLASSHPDLLAADFAVLMEPSNAVVEAGCQGTLRVEVRTTGARAHSARAWMGKNAIHEASEVLTRLTKYEPRHPVIDGLTYREGLNAVRIEGGVAGNVIPDSACVTVNFRFAPDRSSTEAIAFVEEFFDGFDVKVVDESPGALPGLEVPAAADFIAAVGGEVNPKFGWTDVARFSSLGTPAVNYGPGDPNYAHHRDEHVPLAQITSVEAALRTWLTP